MDNLLRDMRFIEVAEAKPDSKNRVVLAKVPIKAHHYRIYVNEAGQIILDPQMSISASEMWLFKNKKALNSVIRGLADAKTGKLVDAPEDYSKYLDEED